MFSDETSQYTGHTLKIFVELVGIPNSLHSDNHKILKGGLHKRLLQNKITRPSQKLTRLIRDFNMVEIYGYTIING